MVGGGVVVLLAAGLFVIAGGKQGLPEEVSQSISAPASSPPVSPSPSLPSGEGAVVRISESGFEPQTLTVPNGTTVTFTNETSRNVWPASGVHPTHTLYPGSGIQKCQTAEAAQIFDACRGLAPGESYLFTFTVSGNHPYHDHLFPAVTGAIVIE